MSLMLQTQKKKENYIFLLENLHVSIYFIFWTMEPWVVQTLQNKLQQWVLGKGPLTLNVQCER
jgi:hypothetical protein